MLFHSTDFAVFLVITIFLVLIAPRAVLYPILVVSSFVFYGWGAGLYTILLAFTSMLDYVIALKFMGDPLTRRRGIIVSAVINFSVLGFFKYANFFLTNVSDVFTLLEFRSPVPLLDIALPIGISFYTFQSFAYVVDVLTGRVNRCRSLSEYLLFSSWFPQLIAGPISRASHLIPQLDRISSCRDGMAGRLPQAVMLFSEGWLRKAFGDLAAISANYFYSQDPTTATGSVAIYGIIGFGLQIYCDFSGYSRMAQGVSWLFGVRLLDNFNIPYSADSITDFWRRWHISLSHWFRDYLYIPLGGNRKGALRTYTNLGLTMVLCGLWHGANWTFVFWGALHGSMLIIERLGRKTRLTLPKFCRHILLVVFVFLAWVPFRSPDLQHTLAAYEAMFNPGWELPTVPLVIAALGIIQCDLALRFKFKINRIIKSRLLKSSIALAICFVIAELASIFGRSEGATFIYFQF
jgi:alginate O-acetyltransferase complex protein AlgI